MAGSLLWPPYVIGQAIIFLPCGLLWPLYFSFIFAAECIGERVLKIGERFLEITVIV